MLIICICSWIVVMAWSLGFTLRQFDAIKTEVVSWLNANGFDSTAGVFALDTSNNANYQLVTDLCSKYESFCANDFRM